MRRSWKLFEIGKCIDGRLEYFYNRKQGERPMCLLTVDNKDGAIHIVKDTIYAPDIIIALISALKHSVEVLKVAKSFHPILDDYVELLVEEWRRAYSEATKKNNNS